MLFRRGIPSAAIGYLKEAEAGFKPGDANLGIVRHHLAQAYEANGEIDRAIRTLERAISDHEAAVDARRAQGQPAGAEPPWYSQAREMKSRLAGG